MSFSEIGGLQLATLVESPPLDKKWIHEIKYDGYRTLCRKEGNTVELLTRNGLDWSHKYRSLQKECKKIPANSLVMDGEIVWTNENGRSNFQGLQNALEKNEDSSLLYYVFDLLFLNGYDIRELPLIERKNLLEEVLRKTNSTKVIYSPHWQEDGNSVFKASCNNGLEGIISKDSQAQYTSGRGKSWLKTKCKNTQEFIIGGYILQKNRDSLGALLLGAINDKGILQYVGKVGTGFSSEVSGLLLKKLQKMKISQSPFKVKSPHETGLFWVRPSLVANIEFATWTEDEILRHASFKGLRKDKRMNEVALEHPVTKRDLKASVITSPDKVLYKEDQLTKKDLLDYYRAIEKWILPYLKDRPLALLRCPEGYDHSCFFQKHLETDEKGIKGASIFPKSKNEKENIIFIDSLEGLFELVQLGSLEIHTRGGDYKNIDCANQIVFDLDPDDKVNFKNVKEAAFELKDLLEELKLKSFVKVSGGKGLHVHVPISPSYDWDMVKEFSKKVCEQLEKDFPQKYTTKMSKSQRKNKIFLDYLRNGYGATAIAPYSVRARIHAPVALPVSWEEVKKLKDAHSFRLKDVPGILKKRRDPWKGYLELRQKVKVLDEFRRGFK